MFRGHKVAIEALLTYEPVFRERRNKYRAVSRIIKDKMPHRVSHIPEETMVMIVEQAVGLDRVWRDVLKKNPDLRGSDYNQKDDLEIEAQRELGYTL